VDNVAADPEGSGAAIAEARRVMTDAMQSAVDGLLEELADRIADRLADRLGERQQQADRWLDTRSAAAHLGVNRDTLRKLAAAGVIASEQEGPGCKRFFRRSDLDAWRAGAGAGFHAASIPPDCPVNSDDPT
jgi:excisionase family DNA binding protein